MPRGKREAMTGPSLAAMTSVIDVKDRDRESSISG